MVWFNFNILLSDKFNLCFGFFGGYVCKEFFSDFGVFIYLFNFFLVNLDGIFNNSGFFINCFNFVVVFVQNEFFYDVFNINNNLQLNYEILLGLEVWVLGGMDGYLQL